MVGSDTPMIVTDSQPDAVVIDDQIVELTDHHPVAIDVDGHALAA